MSLGNSYNNNQKNTVYDPNVYSPYRMNNAESTVDKTCITFTFWKNILRITIAPKKDTGNDETVFDLENGISIYLNHTKARIFADMIKRFMQDPETYDNSGVPSGQGLITISTGKEYNSPSPLIVIRKIDEAGTVLSSFAYQFKNDYYFAINNYSEGGQFTKLTNEFASLEIEQLVTLLEEYYKAMTCATAYTVLDQMKFENNRTSTKLNAIAAKLGVELPGGKGRSGGNYSSTSFFSKSPEATDASTAPGYTSASLDDIE